MDYSDFLKNCQDEKLRKRLWELFIQAESEAKWFSSLHGNWVEITLVEHHPEEAVWDYGKIRIPANWNNLGAIFHEVFHSAFHNSPLGKNPKNWERGNDFCDTFRYYMEERFFGTSTWIQGLVKDSIKLANKIIKKSEYDYEKFKELWKNLNQNSNINLEDFL